MFLKRVIEEKRFLLERKKRYFPSSEMKAWITTEKKKDFYGVFSRRFVEETKIIAEVKRASPSRGILTQDFNLHNLLEQFEKGGASGISVVTEERYFNGSLSFLLEAKATTSLPLLRKDFIVDEYEILESKLYGADCVLLIAEVLEKEALEDFLFLASEVGLDCLVEIHKMDTLEKVFSVNHSRFLLGINARNLETLEVDHSVPARILEHVPPHMPVIVESGIQGKNDVEKFKRFGVSGFLVGTSLVSSPSPEQKLRELKT